MKSRGTLIAVSIIVGIVLACAILPLGSLMLLMSSSDEQAAGSTSAKGAFREQIVSGSGADRVVIIDIDGTIGTSSGGGILGGGQPSTDDIIAQIKQAKEDTNVKALVLRVSSPGGSASASRDIYGALNEFKQSKKPIVVAMVDVAASGGYMVSLPADWIFASPDTLTGSIGVILQSYDVTGLMEKVGVKDRTYKSGKLKDMGSPFHQASAEEDAVIQGIVDETYQRFVDLVVENRKLSREDVLRLADGRIYTGQQALTAKLIDALGNLDDAIAEAKKRSSLSDATVIRYHRASSLSQLLLSSVTQSQQPQDSLGIHQLLEEQSRGPRLEYRATLP